MFILPMFNSSDSGKDSDSKAADVIELNVLDYVKKNDLVIQSGNSEWSLEVSVKSFETEINGCRVRKPDDEPLTEVSVTGKDGKKAGSFMFSYDGNASAGESVKVGYNPNSTNVLTKNGYVLTGEEIIYDTQATGNVSIAETDVKMYAEDFKNWFNSFSHNLDTTIPESEEIELKNIYFNDQGDNPGDIIFVYKNKTQGYYKVFWQSLNSFFFKDGFLGSEGRVFYSETGKTASEALESCTAYDTSNGGTVEKII